MHCLALICMIVVVAAAQDCKIGGKPCADNEQCCGGCCVEGVCIDTYRSCQSSFHVCRDHACHDEENCVEYTPPNCPGCEPMPVCQITN